MKQRQLVYTIIILGTVLIVLAIASKILFQNVPAAPESIKAIHSPKEAIEQTETTYGLGKAMSKTEKAAIPVKVGDMNEVYEKFPKSDVGKSPMEGWANVKPEDKAKIREALDSDIEASREMLKQNPEDKKTKHLLKIAETLKVLIENDFNMKAGEQVIGFKADGTKKTEKDSPEAEKK